MNIMETAVLISLLVVIAFQFGYIIYTDRENRKERERMQLKIMSKDVVEYKEAISSPDKDTPEQRDTYLELDEVDLEKLVNAEDNI